MPTPASADGFAAPAVAMERRADGTIMMRSPLPLGPLPRSAPDLLDAQAALHPDRPFMRQRQDGSGPWRQITYGEMAQASRTVAQWLIDTGHRPGDAVAILSGPSIGHVMMILGAQRAGAAAASVSVNFSLLGQPSEKLRSCIAAIGARFAYVDDPLRYGPAMDWLAQHGVSFIVDGPPRAGGHTHIDDVRATIPGPNVDRRLADLDDDTLARVMFTSGSTGMPKATGLTQSNLMATVVQMEALGFLPEIASGPQILDFMPYSHIFSGTGALNNALRTGATIHLDAGKPTPALFDQTIRNLMEVSPSWYNSAPIGYSMLVDAMEQDAVLRSSFFGGLRYMLVSGATLPGSVRERLDRLSVAETGRVIPMMSAYGATEMSASTFTYWDSRDASIIGLPGPGIEVKLVPNAGKHEIRVRGPNVMGRNGYVGDAAANEAAFDEDGFFRTGDAARLVDPDDPAAGLRFDGRFGEQFKLTSATYVSAGLLRLQVLAALAPLVRELCICGENRDYLTALCWLDETAVATHYPHLAGKSRKDMIASPVLRAKVQQTLRRYNQANPVSSRQVPRLHLEHNPLSFDDNEITDKGSINIRRIWERHADTIAALYTEKPAAAAISG